MAWDIRRLSPNSPAHRDASPARSPRGRRRFRQPSGFSQGVPSLSLHASLRAGESVAPTLRSSRRTARSMPGLLLLPRKSSTWLPPPNRNICGTMFRFCSWESRPGSGVSLKSDPKIKSLVNSGDRGAGTRAGREPASKIAPCENGSNGSEIFFNWGWLAYRVVWVLFATGIATAMGGGVWAVLIGVPLPIAIMAGYCTLVGAVYLAIAPLAYRALAQSPANNSSPQPNKITPDYKVWSHIKVLGLQQAAFLW